MPSEAYIDLQEHVRTLVEVTFDDDDLSPDTEFESIIALSSHGSNIFYYTEDDGEIMDQVMTLTRVLPALIISHDAVAYAYATQIYIRTNVFDPFAHSEDRTEVVALELGNGIFTTVSYYPITRPDDGPPTLGEAVETGYGQDMQPDAIRSALWAVASPMN